MRLPQLPLSLTLVFVSTLSVSHAHAQECTSDDDCDDGYACELDESDAPDCPPDADCDLSPVEPVESSGWCYAEPITCESDAGCPTPAKCDEDGECVYEVEFCEVNADCGENYECIAGGGRSGSCSTGDSADDGGQASAGEPDDAETGSVDMPPSAQTAAEGEAAADAGAGEAQASDPSDTKTPPASLPEEPPADEGDDIAIESTDVDTLGDAPPTQSADDGPDGDVECQEEEEVVRICFPKLIPCESDADCIEDWTCEAVPEGGPEGWADVDTACLPPVISGALDGSIKVVGDGTTQSDAATGAGEEEEVDLDDLAEDQDADDLAEPELMPLGTQGGSEGSAGCAAAGHARGVSGWGLLLLAALGFSVRRRRAPTRG